MKALVSAFALALALALTGPAFLGRGSGASGTATRA
jgi:hypothetical protein